MIAMSSSLRQTEPPHCRLTEVVLKSDPLDRFQVYIDKLIRKSDNNITRVWKQLDSCFFFLLLLYFAILCVFGAKLNNGTRVNMKVNFSEKPVFWKALKPPLKDKCGELLTSLCYHPTNSTLTLITLKARNLKAKDINGKSGTRTAINFNANLTNDRRSRVFSSSFLFVSGDRFFFVS